MWTTGALLAASWIALTGEPSVPNVVFGLVLGLATVRLLGDTVTAPLRPRKVGVVVRFVAYLVWELILANVKVAATVLHPRLDRIRPAIIAVPLDVHTDAEITTLANLITLTPGTLSLDVSNDRRVLYVHVIDAADPDAVRRSIKQGFERLVRELYA